MTFVTRVVMAGLVASVAAMAGRPVATPYTRSYGCSVKYQ